VYESDCNWKNSRQPKPPATGPCSRAYETRVGDNVWTRNLSNFPWYYIGGKCWRLNYTARQDPPVRHRCSIIFQSILMAHLTTVTDAGTISVAAHYFLTICLHYFAFMTLNDNRFYRRNKFLLLLLQWNCPFSNTAWLIIKWTGQKCVQTLSIKFWDWVCKKTALEHHLVELPSLYLSRDIKPVSELYRQRFYKI
jgi:hypothetical protein